MKTPINTHAIVNKEGHIDTRYSTDYEWCGKSSEHYVLRYLGKFLGSYETRMAAVAAGTEHCHNKL